jgi:biopolymer transport protein ExbB
VIQISLFWSFAMFRLSRFRAILATMLIALSLAAVWSPAVAQSLPSTDVQASAAAVESVDNPYGLDALWKTGDLVAKGTLSILLFMSIGSWFFIFTKLYEQFRLGREARAAERTFWSAAGVDQAIQTLDQKSNFHRIATAGAQAIEHHQGLLGFIDLNTWVTLSLQRSIDKVQGRLQGGLAFLATVGSTAPFVGLFGTVWGIYHALTAIGVAGQVSIDKVAGPVGESLIMTAIGLAVAVPAVLGYNWLVRRNKNVLDQVRAFGADLHAVLLGAAAQAARTDVPATPWVVHPKRVVTA